MKRAGSRAGSASGSVSQRYGSEDPDPNQNVTDPEHWKLKISVPVVIKIYSQLLIRGPYMAPTANCL
jgi:hypothetical protein